MTSPLPSTGTPMDCGCLQPSATTPVLLHRKLVPGTDPHGLSAFGDDVWDLTPGLFETHAKAMKLNFTARPPVWRAAIKLYCWHLINHRAPTALRRTSTGRLALLSLQRTLQNLAVFLTWLDTHGIDSIDRVTAAHLDRFLDDIHHAEHNLARKQCILTEVRRLWSYRGLLPESMQLPPQPLWDGEDTATLLGARRTTRENATPRIHPDTLQPLLMWSVRFLDFADDIIAAFAEYQRLMIRGSKSPRRPPAAQRTSPGTSGWLGRAVEDWLATLRQRGGMLPGRVRPDGSHEVDWNYLIRIFDCSEAAFYPDKRVHRLVLDSGLPVAPAAWLDTPIPARLHDRPWRDDPIAYTEAPQLARLLSAAAAVVICYLSGMRPGEMLTLRRGCANYDPVANIWTIAGQQWKGAVDDTGEKLPEGAPRTDPWTTIEVTARAVAILERLHPHPILFPSQLRAHGENLGPRRSGRQQIKGWTDAMAAAAIEQLITWVNQYCQRNGLDDERIPTDPHGRITLSRFRRTLAWHIVRRPRGLIAGAIQYGHLYVKVTLGYAGSYESGFADDYAFEDWLLRLEQLGEREERLATGEHVSGPAADTYRHRVHSAHTKFAGRVVTTAKQAHDLLDNPLLQIFPGRAMTCVLDANKALCQLFGAENGTHRTPDQDDCRPQCHNLAFTDANIAELQARARRLREILADPLAPSIRAERDRHELKRIETIIRRHRNGEQH